MKGKNATLLIFLGAITLWFFTGSTSSEDIRKEPRNSSVVFFTEEYRKDFHPNLEFRHLLFVSIQHQKLYYINNSQVVAKYDISTSRYGVGSTAHSQKTPIGLHHIKHKVGQGVPLNGIIKYGTYAGENANIVQAPEHINEDLITTRVLWLEGLENGINKGNGVDSYNRSIYIHGTAEEGLIGKPASHGCIRMRNKDVMALFNLVPQYAYVLILDH